MAVPIRMWDMAINPIVYTETILRSSRADYEATTATITRHISTRNMANTKSPLTSIAALSKVDFRRGR